jgi:membrane protease YdiL (CAAX protease family)
MKNVKSWLIYVLIFVLCVVMFLFENLPELKELPITADEAYNRLICRIFPLLVGCVAVYLLSREMRIKLFKKPQNLWFLAIAAVVALNNFPWIAWFSGKMQLIHTQPLHFLLFGLYCAFVGLFEEIVFRGICLSLLASFFEESKKGFLWAYLLSSVIFGGVHLLNVFQSGWAAVLQAGYSILTGGLFAFVWMKTKNILFPALIHAVYNFCGLLYTKDVGLGLGSVIDLPTGIMMAIIAVICGVFVLISVFKYPEDERVELYDRLGLNA